MKLTLNWDQLGLSALLMKIRNSY